MSRPTTLAMLVQELEHATTPILSGSPDHLGQSLVRLAHRADEAGFPVAADHLAYLASMIGHRVSHRSARPT